MPAGVAVILGIIVAVAATVLAYIFILPESKRSALPKFFQFVADLFNFKYLVLEKILKALYIFNTLACVGVGFFMLFCFQRSWWGGGIIYEGYWGLIVMILGPVVVRLMYEGMMLIILLVKNTIELNQKFNAQEGSVAEKMAAEEEQKKAEREQAARARQAYLDAQKAAQAQARAAQQLQYTAPQQQYTAQPPQYTAPQQPQQPYTAQPPQYTAPQQPYTAPQPQQPQDPQQ